MSTFSLSLLNLTSIVEFTFILLINQILLIVMKINHKSRPIYNIPLGVIGCGNYCNSVCGKSI